jgi:hypothetical protein
MRLLA